MRKGFLCYHSWSFQIVKIQQNLLFIGKGQSVDSLSSEGERMLLGNFGIIIFVVGEIHQHNSLLVSLFLVLKI